MNRRELLGAALIPLVPASARAQAADGQGWRRYEVATRVDLAAATGPASLWLPLADVAGDYQRVVDTRFESDGRAARVRDPRYGAAMLGVKWDGAGPRSVSLVQVVETRDRTVDTTPLSPAERRLWTAGDGSLPTDGIVQATADRIVLGHAEPRAKLRAIYDWVVDNTFRDAAVRGCGTGGVKNMLETGLLGGKCADINSLMVALSRSAGIPARDAYGVRLGPSTFVKQLGASGDVTRAQHCRAEMWLDGVGWFPVDPADVRKVVLDAKMAVGSPEFRAQRERLFGSWEMNWMAYNHATDIALPGARQPIAENFLMYPTAETPAGELDQLDPPNFKYTIQSREIVA